MSSNSKNPSRRDLEANLARLRDLSTSLKKMTNSDGGLEQPPEKLEAFFLKQVHKQADIVDRFISLSDDRDALIRFTEILKSIKFKTKLMNIVKDPEQYKRLKKEILQHIAEWISCLELIITGVLNKAAR